MSLNEIYDQVIQRFPNKDISDLLKVLIREACEHTSKSDVDSNDKPNYAIIALGVSIVTLKATLEAAFQKTEGVVLNYGGQTFDLRPETPYLKELFSISEELQKQYENQ